MPIIMTLLWLLSEEKIPRPMNKREMISILRNIAWQLRNPGLLQVRVRVRIPRPHLAEQSLQAAQLLH